MGDFDCDNCNFKSLTLKVLLSHIYSSHSQRLNFRTKCNVCELYFTKYNSLYKHTVRHHKELYNGDFCANQILQQKEPRVVQENHEIDLNEDYHDDESSIASSDKDSSSELSDSDTDDSEAVSMECSDSNSDEASDFDEDEIPPENMYEEENQEVERVLICFLLFSTLFINWLYLCVHTLLPVLCVHQTFRIDFSNNITTVI